MKLHVFLDIDGAATPVGTLSSADGGDQFTYLPSYVSSTRSQSLSLSLPIQEGPFQARLTRSYFRNLLPEGDALTAVARRLEVKSSSYMQLLAALGRECIGAVALSTDERFPVTPAKYDLLDQGEIVRLSQKGLSVAAEYQVASRLSLAGAQSKIGLCVSADQDGVLRYWLPRDFAASTHIVKTANRRFEGLSENECFCLRLAARCGLKVPHAMIDVLSDGQPLFVIERYDRTVKEKGDEGEPLVVNRLHQEDFCQALGKPPERKYEKSGQHYLPQMRDVLVGFSSRPIEDLHALVRMVVFSVLIGNCDAHLKNYSLLYGRYENACELAPLYDVSSTVVYEGLDRHLAMRFGSASRVDDVERADLAILAKDLQMSKQSVERIADTVIEGIAASLDKTAIELCDEVGYRPEKLDEVIAFTREQVKKLSR